MNFRNDTISLSRIDLENHSFRISTPNVEDRLTSSIASVGILNPPIVIELEGVPLVVSGFKRLLSCRKLHWKNVPVRFLPPDISNIRCIRIAITENAGQRKLNLVELSRIFHLLYRYYGDYQQVAHEASRLGLPDKPIYIKKIEALCRLPEAVQKGILSDTISLATAVQLDRMPEHTAVGFAKIFNALHLSLSKQREIITLAGEIAARDDGGVDNVLRDAWAHSRADDKERDRAQIVRDLRTYLKHRRFPHYSAAEKHRYEQIRQLKLLHGISLSPPPGFEGNTYTFNISFKTLDDLDRQIKSLTHTAASPHFKELIESD